ncbi:hypothetical protein JCGZ_23716 [Jatropha curcas]|uniref:Uncharacterized protein n=1 Tax=Jatropha curcas TaxID=180498 RepID=A0A067JP88_JATCU|nr:hypothetical protein JCGZ_23716 [Jatropha curcas]
MISKGVKWEIIVGVAGREGRRRDCLDRAKVPSFAVTLVLTRNGNGEKGRKAGCYGEESTARRRSAGLWLSEKRGEVKGEGEIDAAGRRRKERKRKKVGRFLDYSGSIRTDLV